VYEWSGGRLAPLNQDALSMAKPVAPLLSFAASGTIAKTQVYSRWRGRSYVRRWTVPANPQSTAQMNTRDLFSWLQAVWKRAPTDFQAPWTAFAMGKVLTNRNAFTQQNVKAMIMATDLSAMVASPGANAGLAAASMTTTPGSAQLTLAVTAPAVPGGWTISAMIGMAILSQDPHSGTDYEIAIGSDTSSPYSIVLTGLTASSLYDTFAWPVWAKPDSSVAYGPSIASSGTPS
jgi:hypothetical protein